MKGRGFGPSPNFITLTIMATKTSVFPLYLDAAAVTASADDATFAVTSSRVILNGTAATVNLTVDDLTKIEVGTIVHFECSNADNAVTVTLSNPSDGTSLDKATFAANEEGVAMYFDGGWRWIALHGPSLD